MNKHKAEFRSKLSLLIELEQLWKLYEDLLHENTSDKKEIIRLTDELTISKWLRTRYENKYNTLKRSIARLAWLNTLLFIESIILLVIVTTR